MIVDWDGPVIPDRSADAVHARERIEALGAAGVHVIVVSGTQASRTSAANRVGGLRSHHRRGPTRVFRPSAIAAEEQALDRAA